MANPSVRLHSHSVRRATRFRSNTLQHNLGKQIHAVRYGVTPNRPGLVPGPRLGANNYVSSGGTTTTPTNKSSVRSTRPRLRASHIASFTTTRVFDSGPGPSGVVGLPHPLWNGQVSHYEPSDYRMSEDWTITPRLLNHFSIGGNDVSRTSYSPNSGNNWNDKVCIRNAVDCNTNFPNITFSAINGMGQHGL